MRKELSILSTFLLLGPFAMEVSATPILDQFYDPAISTNFSGVVSSDVDQAQTFAVGLSGQLTSIELLLRDQTPTNGVIVDVRPTVGGVPVEDDSAALASVLIGPSSLPSTFSPIYVAADLSSFGLFVSNGDELAIVIRSVDGADLDTVGNRSGTGDNYLGGTAYARTSGGWFQICSFGDCSDTANFVDWGFKTFVEVGAVPEPTMMLLIALTFLALAGYARRREYQSHTTSSPE